MSNRIYGTRTDINEQEVRDFYNKRAALASSMKNPLSAVVNGEQNPEQADTRSRFDREYIVPRLDLTPNSAVLDIGCGMGRFAEMVLPLCGRYLGADFAPEMIAAAEKTTQDKINKDLGMLQTGVWGVPREGFGDVLFSLFGI